jgi:hypothetical protein
LALKIEGARRPPPNWNDPDEDGEEIADAWDPRRLTVHYERETPEAPIQACDYCTKIFFELNFPI